MYYHHEEPYTYTTDIECDDCCNKAQTIDNAADCLKAVLEALYSGEKLDTELLERNLEDCAHFLGVDFNFRKDVKVERKKETMAYLANWLAFNNAHLKETCSK